MLRLPLAYTCCIKSSTAATSMLQAMCSKQARYPVSQCKTPVDDHLLSCLAVFCSSTTCKHHHRRPINKNHHSLSPFFFFRTRTHLLPPKGAALRQSRLPTGRLAQHGRAAAADDDGLGVREDGCDGEAAGALDVHEEGAGGRYEGLAR